jgi:hypothetical protein|tara:strand:+ start:7579 stop:7896 length:318 start_codon:yes stop_codon:yes gene_type:complete
MAKAKSFQQQSEYEEYDLDGDGVITDEELAHAKEIRQAEHDMRKQRAQRRMATASLVGMGAFTAAMFFVPVERVQVLSDISNLFYISGAGIVGAYMGTTAWMSRK